MKVKKVINITRNEWKKWLEAALFGLRPLREEMAEFLRCEYENDWDNLEIDSESEKLYYDARRLEEDEGHELPGITIVISDERE